MENFEATKNTDIKKPKTLTENPEYFGAYLNMARHNVFLIINHLTETFSYLNFKPIGSDENITANHILVNIFDISQKTFEDERTKVFNYITRRHFFPFFKIFIQENLKVEDRVNIEETDIDVDFHGLHLFIKNAFEELNKFRNAYTHYLAIDDAGNQIGRKQNFESQLKPTIKLLFKYAPQYSFIRNCQTQIV